MILPTSASNGPGLERWIHLGLLPLLTLLGIGRSAANVTVIGFTLGLSYGAGLLIRDVQNGVLSRRDSTKMITKTSANVSNCANAQSLSVDDDEKPGCHIHSTGACNKPKNE